MNRIEKIQTHFPLSNLPLAKPATMQEPRDPRILIQWLTPDSKNFAKVTLNNESQLNAFDIRMSMQLLYAIENFHKYNTKAVIFKGAGPKAFCAGGDVKTQYLIKNNLLQDPLIKVIPDYHRQKFACDYRTAKMKPLQISIWDGYVMGGGVGVSAHSDFIIVTERAVFAMPEAKIGFFTDVSGGWVLGRMRNNLGKWLGLTGEVLKGESIVKAGLAKFFVAKKYLGELESELQSVFESFGEQKG
jgi:3-hydroxyisobutyryl-CoA hydrolase